MTGTLSHEKIVREILSGIQTLDSITTIKAEHNVTVQGRMDTHTVDVYWEFTDGDITYKTIIKTTDWNKAVSNSELFSFLSMLRDIPGQTTGVLFTQPVYRKDTKELAADAGVLLYELVLPDDENFKEAVIYNPQINVDAEWAKKEKERLGLESETISFGGDPRYIYLYDEGGNCVDSLNGLLNTYTRKYPEHVQGQPVTHYFKEPTFLQIENERIPQVKLESISFMMDWIDPAEIHGEDLIQTILEYIVRYYSR